MKTWYETANGILGSHSSPLAALVELRKTVPLSRLLYELRADSGNFGQIVDRSYRHDNGFTKLPLSESATNGLKLVLHIWQQSADENHDNIHNHRWDFASVVLCGELQFELYELDPAGEPYPALRYSSPGDEDVYHTAPAEDAHATRKAIMTMTAGSTYQWNMALLHRAWGTGRKLAATLIVQGPPRREYTTVLLRSTLPSGSTRRLSRVRPVEVERQIRAIESTAISEIWSCE